MEVTLHRSAFSPSPNFILGSLTTMPSLDSIPKGRTFLSNSTDCTWVALKMRIDSRMKCCNTDHQIPALSSLSLAFSSPNAFDYPDYAPIPSPSPSSVPLFSQWTIPLHRYELFRVIPALTFSISSTEPSDPSLESAVFQEGVPIRVVRPRMQARSPTPLRSDPFSSIHRVEKSYQCRESDE